MKTFFVLQPEYSFTRIWRISSWHLTRVWHVPILGFWLSLNHTPKPYKLHFRLVIIECRSNFIIKINVIQVLGFWRSTSGRKITIQWKNIFTLFTILLYAVRKCQGHLISSYLGYMAKNVIMEWVLMNRVYFYKVGRGPNRLQATQVSSGFPRNWA